MEIRIQILNKICAIASHKNAGPLIPPCDSPTQPFHDRGRYHIETSPLICGANQWTDFYMITVSFMKELKVLINNNAP